MIEHCGAKAFCETRTGDLRKPGMTYIVGVDRLGGNV